MKKVWVNGCFDILHRGHIELFKYAKEHGDYLIVGLDEDVRVSANKGPTRPVNNLKYIDEVVSFGSDTELEAQVDRAKPDIMVVGSDWKGKNIIAGHLVKNVLYFNRLDGYSTTGILENG